MGVGADVAGDDEAARAVAAGAAARRRDPPVDHVDVLAHDPHGIERGDDRGPAEDHECEPPCRARCGTAASAAGDSFIGRRVRRIPSNA